MDVIDSISYNKRTSEYRIVRRNLQNRKASTTLANHLTDQEKLWAKINRNTRYEDKYSIQWTIHHSNF